MSYQNKSIYFIPLLIDNYKNFINDLKNDSRFCVVDKKERPISYLLKYAQKISCCEDYYQEFRYTDFNELSSKLFDISHEPLNTPELCDMRISCFSTGIAFAEFWINYNSLTIEEIIEFAYKFKKANKKNLQGISLFDITKELVPSAEIFFSAAASFKQECDCFHMIKTDDSIAPETLEEALYLLSWNYNHNFSNANFNEGSDFDMVYSPYQYDNWSGSQNGLVDIFRNTDDPNTNYFIENYKPSLLATDYRFMYLLLLNQRYSAIEYISLISDWEHVNPSKLVELNKKIVVLKTCFSFRIISDDKIFQNVYIKMYEVLKIDCLLSDIRDNEEMMGILRNEASVRTDKLTNKVLFGLSFLSLFSALIDSAGFFDRFTSLKEISTTLSLLCVMLFILTCIGGFLKNKLK